MKKLTMLLATLLTSSAVNAECSVLITAKNEQIMGDMPAQIYGRQDFNITNTTSAIQTYQICHELSTQTYSHTMKYTTSGCENVSVAPGQSTGTVKRGFYVDIRYPRNPYGYYFVSLDSIMEIKGECTAKQHVIKHIKVV